MNYVAHRPAVLRLHVAHSSVCAAPGAERPAPFFDADSPAPEAEEPSDLEYFGDSPANDADWEAFIADDDERDPLPEPGDFWVETDHVARGHAA